MEDIGTNVRRDLYHLVWIQLKYNNSKKSGVKMLFLLKEKENEHLKLSLMMMMISHPAPNVYNLW